MAIVQVLLIAVGLAADAFAVSVAEGAALGGATRRHALRVSLHFGGFQAAMPIVGWLAGQSVRDLVGAFDHWVAFALLVIIGGKGILEAVWGFKESQARDPSTGWRLLALSVATSIDALAVGISLAMLEVNIWEAATIIGVVTGTLCAIGLYLGDRIGAVFGRWAECFGGSILCAIGLGILLRHLSGG